jgi:hypothetical protein
MENTFLVILSCILAIWSVIATIKWCTWKEKCEWAEGKNSIDDALINKQDTIIRYQETDISVLRDNLAQLDKEILDLQHKLFQYELPF